MDEDTVQEGTHRGNMCGDASSGAARRNKYGVGQNSARTREHITLKHLPNEICIVAKFLRS